MEGLAVWVLFAPPSRLDWTCSAISAANPLLDLLNLRYHCGRCVALPVAPERGEEPGLTCSESWFRSEGREEISTGREG